MNIRTDIAFERHNLLPEKHREGIKVDRWKRKNVEIVNKERQIAFTVGENVFELTLVQKRKPK